jgi:hypothetical protein
MKATGLFRWQDNCNTYYERFETSWGDIDSSNRLLRFRFYKYLINRGEFFSNLELIESKVEP